MRPAAWSVRRLTAGLGVLGFLFFLILFISHNRSPGRLDFWWGFSASLLILSGLALALDRDLGRQLISDIGSGIMKKISLGVASAAVLYVIFQSGGILAKSLFPWAEGKIAGVYAFKAGASTLRIGMLMLLVIGPGEEIFWRGFLQRRLQTEMGARRGWLAASSLYAAVHIGSGNIVLILAACLCGLFWGFLYLRYRSVLLNAVSHTLWDMAIFLIRPLG